MIEQLQNIAFSARPSANDLLDYAAVLIIEDRLAAAVALEDELVGVQAEEMQHGGEIIRVVDDVFDREQAEIVGRAVDVAAP